jgi:hypothetical protein
MTKKEKELLAEVRNKFTPILTFFELWEMLGEEGLDEEKKVKIYDLIAQVDVVATESTKEVAELLHKFG